MTKDQAKTELRLLSNGTLATLTGINTYKEQSAMLAEKLDIIDNVDVSECNNWKDVWEVVSNFNAGEIEAVNSEVLSYRQELLAAGMKEEELGNWCSDLHVLVNPISKKWLESYQFKMNVKTFRSEIDGTLWYDVPFGYMSEHVTARKKGKA